MPEDKNKVEIPIELINNLVVIPVTVNRFLPLKFILDTGVETAILTEPDFAPLLGVEYIRKITIAGAGINDSISAFVSQGLIYELPGGIIGHNMNLLVLDDNYLKLSERMGQRVHGILGGDLFTRFAVEIDYDDNVLRLYRNDKFKPSRRHQRFDIDINGSKPYVNMSLSQGVISDSVKLMVDSGASHALLLDASQSKISLPKTTIQTTLGAGLGGDIPGKLGRLQSVDIKGLSFKDVIVSIPELDAYSQAIKRGSRQGTLGGELLSRINPVFDYQNQAVYFSKGKQYKKPFEYDMSGLSLIVKGSFLDTLKVESIRDNSPAERAGILVDDVILSINGLSLSTTNLNGINSLLRGRNNKKLRVRILRNTIKSRKILILKRAI